MATVNAYPYSIMGLIARTVASNNLTVALKNFDGTNFSSSAPMVHKIGGAPRSLTGALSVTVNAGANSFNAGSAELATKEIDYFVYLGWRAASSTVFILISRIPYARVYGDFSGTATNEKYAAFSGSTPASTDEVVNIGRFNATLSAGASYNWSVPATDIILQHPIYETRWLTWVPQHTRAGGAYTNLPTVNEAFYKVGLNEIAFTEVHTQHATPGSSGVQKYTLPFTNPSALGQVGAAWNATTGVSLAVFWNASSNQVSLYKYDGTAEATASNQYHANAVFKL